MSRPGQIDLTNPDAVLDEIRTEARRQGGAWEGDLHAVRHHLLEAATRLGIGTAAEPVWTDRQRMVAVLALAVAVLQREPRP